MLLKDFKKLVGFCRAAGILTYKSTEVEFVLSPENPKDLKTAAKKLAKVQDAVESTIDNLSDEDILLYSSQGINEKDL